MASTNTHIHGLWDSPISARSLAASKRISDVQWDSDSNTLVWLERRDGKSFLVCSHIDSTDAARDITTDFAIRAEVGYGGGDFCVAGGNVFFVERASGRIYRQSIRSGTAKAITPAFGKAASPTLSPDGKWVAYIHSYEDTDVLAVVDAEGNQLPQRLSTGHDFYMQPVWHPSGEYIAYIAWDHPNMPWDGTHLFLATLEETANSIVVRDTHMIAGSKDIAIFQPAFSPNGQWLSYISDESGWGHIYLYHMETQQISQLTNSEFEHGLPAWVQAMRTYAWSADSSAMCVIRSYQGLQHLFWYTLKNPEDTKQINPDVVSMEELANYTSFDQPTISPRTNTLAVIASSSTQTPQLLIYSGQQHANEPNHFLRIMSRSTSEQIQPSQLATAKPVSWHAEDGTKIHGLLSMPPNQGDDPKDEQPETLPPAIVLIHGGPTGQAIASFYGNVQFFATRGYVVLQVNYRGSAGYGRAYMEMLRGKWGVYDVEDAVSGARYLAEQGIADSKKIVIMGGSAGGYTVLEALCRAPNVFRAGICMYGVSDLFRLADETHKFEARYLDSLIGVLPADSDRYRERSPLFHADLLQDPVAVFQGDEDQVVPRSQSDKIVESLRKRGIPHEYHIYEGEGHGWRKPETIEKFYHSVEQFLRHVIIYA